MTTIPSDPGLTTYNSITIYDFVGLLTTMALIVLIVIPPLMMLLTYGLMPLADWNDCDD